jgi:hypothetical protein
MYISHMIMTSIDHYMSIYNVLDGEYYEAYKWYNLNKVLHRDFDKPAIVYLEDDAVIFVWFQNGKEHRFKGRPASIYRSNKYLLEEFYEYGEKQLEKTVVEEL